MQQISGGKFQQTAAKEGLGGAALSTSSGNLSILSTAIETRERERERERERVRVRVLIIQEEEVTRAATRSLFFFKFEKASSSSY